MFNIIKRRLPLPLRNVEFLAIGAMFITVFLFIHTNELTKSYSEYKTKQKSTIVSNLIIDETTNKESSVLSLIETKPKYKKNFLRSLQTTEHLNDLTLDQLNNTKKAESLILFFNRVPKVGSQTFMELLRKLSIRNGFYFNRDRVQKIELIRLTLEHQNDLTNFINEFEEPGSYIKHVCFLNFSRFNLRQPIYVNLVRDPVERVISWYYYIRAPWYYVERKQLFPDLPLPDPLWLKKDFETCVLQGDRECTYITGETEEGIGDHRRQSMFFCGHDDDCTPFNTKQAIEKAKYVVENYYSVVGVLEDLNTTLTVLEHYIPQFFQGASEVYWNEVYNLRRINRNMFKPTISEDVKNIIRRNFSKEIEFYEFCKDRLRKQLLALQIEEHL